MWTLHRNKQANKRQTNPQRNKQSDTLSVKCRSYCLKLVSLISGMLCIWSQISLKFTFDICYISIANMGIVDCLVPVRCQAIHWFYFEMMKISGAPESSGVNIVTSPDEVFVTALNAEWRHNGDIVASPDNSVVVASNLVWRHNGNIAASPYNSVVASMTPGVRR